MTAEIKKCFASELRIVPGEQLHGGPVHPLAFGQHSHSHFAVDESGRFRSGPRGSMRRRSGPVQRARFRPEPQLPGLFQTKQQERTAGDGRRQGVDVQDTVRVVRWIARRRSGGQLPVRQHTEFQ